VSRRDSVAISVSCEWRRPGSNRTTCPGSVEPSAFVAGGTDCRGWARVRYLRPIAPRMRLASLTRSDQRRVGISFGS
jgi:hypothetical protein